MALSKKVQRSLDPNNKHWAEDKSRFGYRLLQKYGWDEGKGLGANEDGSTTHIKVTQKADTRGVGSPDVVDPWLQNNSSYNNVLARLASIGGSTPPPQETPKATSSQFIQSTESYTTTDSPSPKHFVPPNVKKHKLARYSETEMRGIFATPSQPAPTPETALTRFTNVTPTEEIDQFTVTSTMSIFDYFASKKKSEPLEVRAEESTEKSAAEVAEPSENKKKRKRESDEDDHVEEESKERKKKKKKKRDVDEDKEEETVKTSDVRTFKEAVPEAIEIDEEDEKRKKRSEEKSARKKDKKEKRDKKKEKKEKRSKSNE